jgi:microsomal dipeptidase-like Zn-dependent dipeptidase
MEYLKTTGGIVGLIPSDDYLEGGQTGPCFSGLLEFKKQIQELEQRIGKYKVMIGSDFNSPLKGLSAACGAREGEILGVFESTGFFRQDQFKSLSDFVGSDPDWTRSTEEAFLSNWEKVRSH